MSNSPDIGAVLADWAAGEPSLKALVLFGSRARPAAAPAAADGWSDVDLHVITAAPDRFEDRGWAAALPGLDLGLYVVRPASGGVRKVTLIFATGEADLVIVPLALIRRLRRAARLGEYRRRPDLRHVLNEFSTIMRGGYRFLKGERPWGAFYAWAIREMPGQRLGERETAQLANVFLCDLLWVFQRIARGELVAAQRSLHRLLAEPNFQLLHEARLRRDAPTFREARRVEKLLSPRELALVQVSARLDRAELNRAARQAYRAFRRLTRELHPGWAVPASIDRLLAPYLRG
jgi:hypothetical protein